MKQIPITGVEPHDPNKKILSYAVCRQWGDNPRDVEVVEYAISEHDAKAMIKALKKNNEKYRWFIGVYQ